LNIDNLNILSADFDQPPWNEFNFTFLNPFTTFDKASTADIIFKQIFSHHRQCYSTFSPIFTDGSKSEDFVGCAYSIGNRICKYRLHPAFSSFSAEIIAILKVLEYLDGQDKGNFIIYTDCLSVLQSLSSPEQRSNPLIFKVLDSFHHLISSGFTIKFCWVPSHVGIKGNELVDKAAKSASEYLQVDLPYSDAKKFANVLMCKIWQQSWDDLPQNKLRSIKPRIMEWPSQSARKCDVVLTRLRIGHTRFTHRHLLLGEQAPTCKKCNVTMTVKHILVECPVFNSQRSQHFNNHHISLKELLSAAPHQNIFNFLKHIGFYSHI
jgi:ribonuclease HI